VTIISHILKIDFQFSKEKIVFLNLNINKKTFFINSFSQAIQPPKNKKNIFGALHENPMLGK